MPTRTPRNIIVLLLLAVLAFAGYTVADVKKALDFETYKDQQTGEWIVPYAKFAHFKIKVLDAVQADLKRMAAMDPPATDITFTYESVYSGGRRRGDPDYIEFHVVSTDLGIGYNLLTGGKPSPATNEAKAALLATEQDMFSDEYQQTWQRCIDDMCNEVRDGVFKVRFMQMVFESYDKAKRLLTIQVPSKQFYEWIESDKVLAFFYGHLCKHFGKGVKPQYRLPKTDGGC